MRKYFAPLLLLIPVNCFAVINRGNVDSLKSLLSINSQQTPDTVKINRLNKLAADYFDRDPDSTLFYSKQAIELSQKINYKSGLANGLLQTAHANYFRGDFKNAKIHFEDAISLYKQIGDKGDLAICYILYGKMFNLLADYKSALVYLNLALDIDKQFKYESGIGDTYKNIGIVYYSEGQLPTALDYYFKALTIAKKGNDNLAAAANYNDIGVVLQNMRVYPKALEYYKNAIKMFKAANDPQGVGTVQENIGEILLAQKDYKNSIRYLNKSIKIAKEQDDKDGMSSVYTDLGLCYANMGQFKTALNYLNTSLQIASKYKIVYNEATTRIGFATMYNLQKDYASAYTNALNGQQLALKLGNLGVRANAALQLNKSLAGLGKYDEAYHALNQYIDLQDSLNNNLSIQKLTSYTKELDFHEKERQRAEQQQSKDELYQERIEQQRLVIAIFLIIILGMLGISVVYYLQKRKHQKINTQLEEVNREVLQQKTNLDDQAQKLNDLNVLKDRLISVLAHDLRAPLSTLRGLFSLLQDDTISHQQLLEMIPNVLKKLEYTSDFLDTLLFWINSQMDNFDRSTKKFYMKDIVAYEVENYQEQAALKGITIIDHVDADLRVLADPNSIRIVVRNLITNAIKFSGDNDTIEINARQEDEHTHLICIKDTGMGMSEEQLQKLFKSKVTSNTGTANEAGTGMGLLFCKDLIEKCHGRIWVTSKKGHGTEFFFTLPAVIPVEVNVELKEAV